MKSKCFFMTAIILISVSMALTASIAKAEIHVYDKNNQYLGIMVYMHDNDMDLFISSLGGTFRYSPDYSGWCGDEIRVIFASGDCTGTPYSEAALPQIFDFSSCPIEGFYKVDYDSKNSFTPGSYYVDGGVCEVNEVLYPYSEYYPFVQVQLPFTTPIALPLRFEVETQTVTQTEIMPFPIVVAPKNK